VFAYERYCLPAGAERSRIIGRYDMAYPNVGVGSGGKLLQRKIKLCADKAVEAFNVRSDVHEPFKAGIKSLRATRPYEIFYWEF
jgi:hypothetical protein